MPASGGPGQQAIPKAIRAMPATRATGMATPVSSSPSNNCPTSDGTISNAKPGRGFADSGENQHLFHRADVTPFRSQLCSQWLRALALACCLGFRA